MRVIGTAGHVDHGKSTLVRALTGIDPDRLAEEKARQLTIDLGFAWLSLPDATTVGVVDVPGHRDFIENMLAGVGGVDAALLVVAADEGVMPQTREHLAILDLLGIEHGLIVLTKIDLAEDAEWLDLIEQEVLEVTQDTILQDAPVLRVSAHSGAGLPELVATLATLLGDLPERGGHHHPRLPIDRVFTVSGFGTVVTGTLSGGTLSVGDEVELQPSGKRGRIRGLQSYKQSVTSALPGSRVAVNLSGVDKNEVERGDVLAYPGQLRPTLLTDVYFRHLPDAERPLKHNTEVKFFSGATETLAHVRLLNDEQLPPGAEGWLQLRLRDPLPLSLRDRFILRLPSPARTIGGGVVINPQPGRRWKRFRADLIADLATRLEGTPAERVAQAADADTPRKRAHLQQATGYPDDELDAAIAEGLNAGLLVQLSEDGYLAMRRYQRWQDAISRALQTYHHEEPLRLGMPREALRSQMGIKNQLLGLLLSYREDIVAEAGGLLRSVEHEVRFTDEQQRRVDAFWARVQDAPYSPPAYHEAREMLGEPVLRALIDLGWLVQVQSDVIFARQAYDAMVAGVLEMIESAGQVDAKAVRDRFGSTRKYVIGLLEHLDALGITKRVEDVRVKGPRAQAD